MNTNRLETFADGVFAIAATLLILNVDAQVPEDTRDLGALLLHIWPSYAAYAVTFFTIGIVWVNHHNGDADRPGRPCLPVPEHRFPHDRPVVHRRSLPRARARRGRSA
jgi:hypothetical protein